MSKSKNNLKILLASPRGFCAGVDRAVAIVEEALKKFGAPVYVRHDIVHNGYVVNDLRQKGAVFVEELADIPPGFPVIFSAHGVAKEVVTEAEDRHMIHIDATCPLVSKVHREAERYHALGYHILLIGHQGHPEVIGTMGQLPKGAVTLIQTLEDAKAVKADGNLAYVTQTTLSVDDTAEIVAYLKMRFPNIQGPRRDDICYATTNRQAAVKAIAGQVDMLFVLGAPHSSNSLRLVEVAQLAGCQKALLIERAGDINWVEVQEIQTLGITASASAPEILVEEVIAACRSRFEAVVEEVRLKEENVTFKLPPILAENAA
ncbi:MAG: 4-hydroxy-3-methylbut-2-enyl diphosphate reductase [Dongiaceae bacterium]